MNSSKNKQKKSWKAYFFSSPFIWLPLISVSFVRISMNLVLSDANEPIFQVVNWSLGLATLGLFSGVTQWLLAQRFQNQELVFWWIVSKSWCGAIGGLIGGLLSLVNSKTTSESWLILSIVTIMVMTIGTTIGFIQRFAQRLQPRITAKWIITGTLGGAVGGTISVFLIYRHMTVALLGILTGIIHWFVLRRRPRSTERFISSTLLGTVGGIIGLEVGKSFLLSLDMSWLIIGTIILLAVIGAAGFTMFDVLPFFDKKESFLSKNDQKI
jgi:hypothetical protein